MRFLVALALAALIGNATAQTTLVGSGYTVSYDTLDFPDQTALLVDNALVWNTNISGISHEVPFYYPTSVAFDFQASPGYAITGYELSYSVDVEFTVYDGPYVGYLFPGYASLGGNGVSASFSSSFSGLVGFHVDSVEPAVKASLYTYAGYACIHEGICNDISSDLETSPVSMVIHSVTVTPDLERVPPVPEPETYALLALGLAAVAVHRRRHSVGHS